MFHSEIRWLKCGITNWVWCIQLEFEGFEMSLMKEQKMDEKSRMHTDMHLFVEVMRWRKRKTFCNVVFCLFQVPLVMRLDKNWTFDVEFRNFWFTDFSERRYKFRNSFLITRSVFGGFFFFKQTLVCLVNLLLGIENMFYDSLS